jgi:hypothetical protein
MSTRLTRRLLVDETFEYQGYWWLPERDEDKVLVSEGPSEYDISVGSSDVDYTITVEECTGTGGTTTPSLSPQPSPSPPPRPNPAPSPPPRPTPAPARRPTPPPAPAPQPESGTLMNAGGPTSGPMPTMPNGSCPREFPTVRDEACYLG